MPELILGVTLIVLLAVVIVIETDVPRVRDVRALRARGLK